MQASGAGTPLWLNVVQFCIAIWNLAMMCRIFAKLGIVWWKALIPFYGPYVLYSTVWSKKVANWVLGLSLGAIGFTVFGWIGVLLNLLHELSKPNGGFGSLIWMALWILGLFALAITLFIFQIQLYVRMGHCFEKKTAFIWGMVLLPVVFMTILAFDSTTPSSGSDSFPNGPSGNPGQPSWTPEPSPNPYAGSSQSPIPPYSGPAMPQAAFPKDTIRQN